MNKKEVLETIKNKYRFKRCVCGSEKITHTLGWVENTIEIVCLDCGRNKE